MPRAAAGGRGGGIRRARDGAGKKAGKAVVVLKRYRGLDGFGLSPLNVFAQGSLSVQHLLALPRDGHCGALVQARDPHHVLCMRGQRCAEEKLRVALCPF